MKTKKVTIDMIVAGIIIILLVILTLATSARPEAPENNSSDFTMTPFKDTDFTSGEFDEEALAKGIWTRYLDYCEVYNTCINKSMTPTEYTEEDYLVMEHNGVMTNFIGMLPITDSRFHSVQDIKSYIESISTESYAEYLYSIHFLLGPETPDFAKLTEYNGTLYSRIYDHKEPLVYEQGDAFLFLFENNEVYLVVRNEPTSSFVSLSFAQKNGVWCVNSHPHFDTYIPDSINRTVHKYSFSPKDVMSDES